MAQCEISLLPPLSTTLLHWQTLPSTGGEIPLHHPPRSEGSKSRSRDVILPTRPGTPSLSLAGMLGYCVEMPLPALGDITPFRDAETTAAVTFNYPTTRPSLGRFGSDAIVCSPHPTRTRLPSCHGLNKAPAVQIGPFSPPFFFSLPSIPQQLATIRCP
ncbi:unnamed protein product [Arctogadus glacialis]